MLPVPLMALAAALHALACANALANRRLHGAVAGLSPEAFAAPRPGFFPGLRATLNHILIVDRFYLDALEGLDRGRASRADPEPCPDAPALAAAQAVTDRRLIAHCAGLTSAALTDGVAIDRGDRIETDRRDRVLLHLFAHQTHHRGQAHAMLSHAGATPPQLDEFILDEDTALRAPEMAALGLRETDLWRGA